MGIIIRLKECKMKAAVSFQWEHGIFLKEKTQKELDMRKGAPVETIFAKENMFGYERWRDFKLIDVKREAKALLALLQALMFSHYSFLGEYGITCGLEQRCTPNQTLTSLYPDFEVKSDSAFRALWRKVEDYVVGIPKTPKSFSGKSKKRVDEAIALLSNSLEDFYNEADCVIGAGSYLSAQVSKPVEVSFGIGELDIGLRGPFQPWLLISNPFLLKWLVDDHCTLKSGKLNWHLTDVNVSMPKEIREALIKDIVVKCYVPSFDISPAGPTEDTIRAALREFLVIMKPFVLESDFLLPFHCPSLAMEIVTAEKTRGFYGTHQGPVPETLHVIPKICELTKIEVKFFDFPRFNRKNPVVLDTSSVDISRFPLTMGSMFEAFMAHRTLIIPKVVMHELKTRLRTPDGPKVEKALLRLNNWHAWKFIKEVLVEGEFPQLSEAPKKDIEDLRDCMILDLAGTRNGVIFTNDDGLFKLAMLNGIYCITFRGLEEDLLTIVRKNNLKLTVESAVKATQAYGFETREEEYREEDIKWMIECLLKQGSLRLQKLRQKTVLNYVGPSSQKTIR